MVFLVLFFLFGMSFSVSILMKVVFFVLFLFNITMIFEFVNCFLLILSLKFFVISDF